MDAPAPSKWKQHLTLKLPPSQPGCVWIHACSVGEVGSVVPLIRRLLDAGYNIHLSVVTRTGFAHARRLLGHRISLSYIPWDLPGLMLRFIRRLSPRILLLTETEFWPGMLRTCGKRNIPVIGINTRISDRSFGRYRASRWLWRHWLAPIRLFLAQSQIDAARLAALGIEQERIRITGNLKYAVSPPRVDAASLRSRVDPSGRRPILLAASTHDDEEKRLLRMWPAWKRQCPELLLMLVPRHPERFDKVGRLLSSHGVCFSRWSDNKAHGDIMLVDAMGVLAGLYTLADVVFIGGSLVEIGGHNPLEAAVCGRGVLTGPHVQNFREVMHHMQTQGAAIVAQNDEELESAILRLLQRPKELQLLHQRAAVMMQQGQKVLEQTWQEIIPWLNHEN